MPELPEVETIVRGLRNLIIGYTIEDVVIRAEKLVVYPSLEEFRESLKGKTIREVDRRGKYILIKLAAEKTLVVHLRMTGRLLVLPRETDYDKHTHIILQLDKDLDLRFHDLRKFGRMYLVDRDDYRPVGGLLKLGPEPLSAEFTLEAFTRALSEKKTNIKALLLDQGFIAGLGNIYTDEALFYAAISPERTSDSLKEEEIEALYNSIRLVLEKGIAAGGTSFSDYRDARGEKGNFQEELQVYRRAGQECHRCGSTIIRTRLAGRGTHYCPGCQK